MIAAYVFYGIAIVAAAFSIFCTVKAINASIAADTAPGFDP